MSDGFTINCEDAIATLEAEVKRLTADKAHLEQQFMEEHERAERLTEERDAATALWNLFLDDPDNAQIKALRAALTTVTEERDEARSLLRQKIAELANDRIALAAKDDALEAVYKMLNEKEWKDDDISRVYALVKAEVTRARTALGATQKEVCGVLIHTGLWCQRPVGHDDNHSPRATQKEETNGDS